MSEFKKLNSDNNNFNKIILLDKNFKFQLTKAIENKNWKDIFFNKNNNLNNFKYNNEFKLEYKKVEKFQNTRLIKTFYMRMIILLPATQMVIY